MYKSIIISQIIATVYFNAKDSERPQDSKAIILQDNTQIII